MQPFWFLWEKKYFLQSGITSPPETLGSVLMYKIMLTPEERKIQTKLEEMKVDLLTSAPSRQVA